jgi:hypothetical protein
MLLKTNIPRLVDFVDWTITHGVTPGFYNFINAHGIEHTFEAENVIAYPWLVEQIPDWERYFVESVRHLLDAGPTYVPAANQLEGLRVAIVDGLAHRKALTARAATLIQITQREALFNKQGKELFKSLQKNFYGEMPAEPPFRFATEGLFFKPTDITDHLATPYVDVVNEGASSAWIRVQCTWPAEGALRSCDLYVQDERFNRLVSVETGSTPQVSEFDRWFEVSAEARKVRIVMTGALTMEEVAVPSSIRIERVSPTAASEALKPEAAIVN